MRAASLLLWLMTGCYAQLAGGAQITREGIPRGGEFGASLGDDRLRLGAGLSAGSHGKALIYDTVTVSAVGLVQGAHREAAPWFDAGAIGGLGLGADLHGALGIAFAGGWTDVRLSRNHARYPTLHLAVERAAYGGDVANEWLGVAGVGWVWRDPSATFRAPD